MAATKKNLRVCQVKYNNTYYDVLIAVDSLDDVNDILQDWALETLEVTLDLPQALIYNKDITEVITTLDIDNFAYVRGAVSAYMDMPSYAGVSGTFPVLPTELSGGLYVVPACNAFLYSQAAQAGYFGEYVIPTKSFALSVGMNFLGIRFNAGVPEWIMYTVDTNFDYSSIIPVAKVLNFSSTLYVLPYGQMGYGLSEKLISIMKKRNSVKIISDFTLDVSTLYIELSALTVNHGSADVVCAAVDTEEAGNDAYLHYNDTDAAWKTTAITQINNTQYQSASGLGTLAGGEFVINYIYRVIDSVNPIIFTVLSNKFASLADAKESEMITDLPEMIKQQCVLVGRIIVEQGSSTPLVQKVQSISWGSVA